jgi:hypothetical protein
VCQVTGGIRAGDPIGLGAAMWAMTHGLAGLIVDGRLTRERSMQTNGDGLAARVVRFVLEGFRPARPQE